MKKIRANAFRAKRNLTFILGWLASSAAMAQIHCQDAGRVIIVRPSTPPVTICLAVNPSTGYQWALIKYDQALMATPTKHYYPQKTRRVGAPGYDVWRFEFKKSAFAVSRKTTVILQYKRPWEKTGQPPQVIRFTIQPQ